MKDWNLWPGVFLIIAIVIAAIIVSIDFFPEEDKIEIGPQPQIVVTSYGHMEVGFRLRGNMFQGLKEDKWEDLLIKGVNLGMTSPGHFPGEAAITYDEYSRWFHQISEMNANCIRIYTIHPPEFYRAFHEYNKNSERPIYLIHGTWVNEDQLMKSMNAFSRVTVDVYYKEIERTVDVIHGNAEISWAPGHAYGNYIWDVSRFVIGYILGIEWDPSMVHNTNQNNLNVVDLEGRYFETEDANPFEIWNAMAMEHITHYEAENYGELRPVAFNNWPTTDPLSHPTGAYNLEDLVSLDPNNITITKDFYPGQFASYHIYPYYPDFINHEMKYREYLDPDGDKSSYGGYLRELIQAHDMPVLVAEFGVPSSRGMTHRQVNGMDHGGLTEQEQADINVKLFKNIVSEGYAGGVLFSWQDEWFKRTWSTVRLKNGDRTPLWSDAMTCEQAYGVMTFDPGSGSSIQVDGKNADWESMENVVALDNEPYQNGEHGGGESTQNVLSSLSVSSDEKYVYFKIELENLDQDLDWDDVRFMILLDTKPHQGQTGLLDNLSLDPEREIDLIIDIAGSKGSRVLIDSYYDPFHYIWAQQEGEMETLKYTKEKDNGIFHPINYVLNRKITIWEQNKTYPFDYYEAGKLNWGISDPEDEDFNSMADIYGLSTTGTIEARIPWLMLNFRDPSRKEILSDIQSNGMEAGEFIEGFNVAVLSLNTGGSNGMEGTDNSAAIIESIPEMVDGRIKKDDYLFYTWNDWDDPEYHERLKPSYFSMRLEYGSYAE